MSVHIDNFETIFGVKDNIQELRNKVLELAIRGKLVEQDQSDEPASELIKKIQVERAQLVKDGKFGKQKPHKPIEKDEIPFEIPENWEWSRLGTLACLIMGQSPDGNSVTDSPENGIEFHQGKTNFGNKILNPSGKYTSDPKKNCPKDSLLISVRAPVGTLNYSDREICIGRGLSAIIPLNGILLDYLYSSVTALQGWLVEQSTGTTFKAITGEVLSSLLIPIPPFIEQQRIVSKIESLMSEIDKLEKSLKKKEHLVELLPKVVVEAIGSCKTGEELKEQLEFVIENFKIIFQTPGSMQELRNVVLQLAIEGKLVPQDPKDEPASVLIGKIKAERDELIKEGKLKKQKPIKSINETDMLEIPESWEIEKLGNVFEIQRGSSPRPKGSPLYFEKNKTEFHWITIWDITNNSKENKLVDTKEYLTLEGSKHSRYVEEGEIIIAVSGSTVGKTSILGIDGYIYDGLAVVKGLNKFLVFRDYLFLFLQSWKNKINNMSEGSAFPNINTDKLNNLLITIPPEAEQHRIVQKVESIMALIDQIEAELMHKDDLVKKLAV